MAAPFRTAEFDIIFNEGISYTGDILNLGEKYEIIKTGRFLFLRGNQSWPCYDCQNISGGKSESDQKIGKKRKKKERRGGPSNPRGKKRRIIRRGSSDALHLNSKIYFNLFFKGFFFAQFWIVDFFFFVFVFGLATTAGRDIPWERRRFFQIFLINDGKKKKKFFSNILSSDGMPVSLL